MYHCYCTSFFFQHILKSTKNKMKTRKLGDIEANQPVIDLLNQYAALKNATNAQISMAWMLHKYPNVVPIPGSKNKERMIENLKASMASANTVLDKIPDKKRGTGIILCLIDKKTYLRENLIALPIEYL